MARTLKDRPKEELEEAAKAVLEYHLDCHSYCGDWCKRKSESLEDRKTSGRYYRCKTTDAKLCVLLQQRISRFFKLDKLIEMDHGCNTSMNEAVNQICTWFAPKNKVYAGSYSLHNRFSFAVGINSLGVVDFFKRLFHKLGISMTENVEHYLKVKEKARVLKHARVKTSAAKKEKEQEEVREVEGAYQNHLNQCTFNSTNKINNTS
jgi:hypothetical protein